MTRGRTPAYNRRGLGRCGRCGKVNYRTRGEARAARRVKHPGDRMSVYQCGTVWHFGHSDLWKRVQEGWQPLPSVAISQIHAMARGERIAA